MREGWGWYGVAGGCEHAHTSRAGPPGSALCRGAVAPEISLYAKISNSLTHMEPTCRS
jgi:hypothetical protein